MPSLFRAEFDFEFLIIYTHRSKNKNDPNGKLTQAGGAPNYVRNGNRQEVDVRADIMPWLPGLLAAVWTRCL